MASLQEAFPNYCEHIDNKPAYGAKYPVQRVCNRCNTQFVCHHPRTRQSDGIWNGRPPTICMICGVTVIDFMGRKLNTDNLQYHE